jgi:predicted transcriptional regulator
MVSKDYELIASLRRSTIKVRILELLGEPKTATDLKKILNVHRESISRALLSLEKQSLVKCVNPTEPNFRYYQLQDKGKKLLKEL